MSSVETKYYRGYGFMTTVKYNNKGDYLYISDKESKVITMVDTINNKIERVFNGHNGVIWYVDITLDDNILISCSGDFNIIVWNAKTGDIIEKINETGIPKCLSVLKIQDDINSNINVVGIYCDSLSRRNNPYIKILGIDNNFNITLIKNITWLYSKITTINWIDIDKLVVGCDDGLIYTFNINDDISNLDNLIKINHHTESIKSIVVNKNRTNILSSSLDCTSKIIELKEMSVLKTFTSECPINFSIYNFNERKVILGGGVEAMLVAKTSKNDLSLKIYDVKSGKLKQSMQSHFGPIRFIDKCPNSKNFATASQDGTVKIYLFDKLNDDDNNNLDITPTQIPIQNIDNTSINSNNSNNSSKTKNKSELTTEFTKIESVNKIVLKTEELKTDTNPKKKFIPGSFEYAQNKKLESKNQNYQITENKEIIPTKFTVKVSNLPSDILLGKLYEMFENFGRIEERGIRIKYLQYDTVAYVAYAYKESADKAINALNGRGYQHHILALELAP